MSYRTFTVDFDGRTVVFRFYRVRYYWRFDMWCGWLEEWRPICSAWSVEEGLAECHNLDFDSFFYRSLEGLLC